MITTSIFDKEAGRGETREVESLLRVAEYKKIARRLLDGGLFLDSEALLIPWGDERFRRMFAGMAATQAHDAEQFRNVSAFVRALIKGA
jgi:hypothetical protein